jgi:crotonobetainyl-CoA:carnitine CoA-transferase CaiB-like acyl-CoA transferase
MDEEGAAGDFLRNMQWDTLDFRTITQETVDRIEEPIRKFFMSHTSAELYEGALRYRVMFYPVSDMADIANSPQLAARDFWIQVEHPELQDVITYPGAFVTASETPPAISRRAPLIGEHNHDIYEKELGMSRQELLMLKQAKVI